MIVTTLGNISGVEQEHCMVYKGVPFARPPVGVLRWRSPQKPEPWAGIYHADRFPKKAVQRPSEPGSFYYKEFFSQKDFYPESSEDCLYLNIWTPKENEGLCPVVVWYHGGAYAAGFCSELEFDGSAYAKRGIILVSAAYRLGILGFLNHPTLREQEGHSGNYGMLDQIAAVDWVREHIASFGGDPERITVMGQSAGALSVRTLVSSPFMRGKIKGAIIQSGGGYKSPFPVNTFDGRALAEATAAALAKLDLTMDDLYGKLPSELLDLQTILQKEIGKNTGCVLCFSPQMDEYSLIKTCDQTLEDGEVLNIPYLIGCNQNDLAAETAGYEDNPLHQSNAAFCLLQKENPHTYVYYFKRQMPGDKAGAFHSAELWYMFGTLNRCWRPLTKDDYALAEQMLDAWAGFIRTGNPGWTAYTSEHPMVKEFDICF